MLKLGRFLGLALSAVLIFGCADAAQTDDVTGGTTGTKVSGTFTIPASSANIVATTGLAGKVYITIGDTRYEITTADITLDTLGNYVVTFSLDVEFEGIVVVTAMSALTFNGTSINYGGYLMTVVVDGEDNNINDTDGDGTVSAAEQTASVFTGVSSSGFTATTAPVFNSFTSAVSTTTSFVTTISATLSQIDWGIVFIRVNDSYRPINLSVNSSGTAAFTESISLAVGNNAIQLFAVNSLGFSTSDIVTVECTATPVTGKENFLFTLTWDGLGDIDLHTWYYAETTPTASSSLGWHNSFSDKGQPTFDSIQNLDVDNMAGFGPEHFTLLGAPDGYYIVAIDSYSLDSSSISPYGLLPINAFVNIQTNSGVKAYGPIYLADDDSESYPINNSAAWARIADIKVVGGVATIVEPNTAIDPPEYSSSAYSFQSRAIKSSHQKR